MVNETEFDSPLAPHVAALGHDDANDKFVVLAVNADGRLEVVIPIEEALGARAYHYDGAAWRRSNLLFGYNAIWDEDLGGTATGATYTVATSVVPAGELWILQGLSCNNQTRATTYGQAAVVKASGAYVILDDVRPLPQYVSALAIGQFVLGEGDQAYVSIGGCQVGDTILAGLVGYKMKLDM